LEIKPLKIFKSFETRFGITTLLETFLVNHHVYCIPIWQKTVLVNNQHEAGKKNIDMFMYTLFLKNQV